MSGPGAWLIRGDARYLPLADNSVQCVVTSPPYWGLRDYGVAGQLGLESTPAEYVEQMVAVFREVKRVLRDDGTCWLNLGDSYNAYNGNAGPSSGFSAGSAADTQRPKLASGHGLRTNGLKPKDLCGIPWRVAFALQAEGWWLRSDIIWHKKNPMPESVTDRPTKAHEYVYLLAKGQWVTRVVKFSDFPSERFHFGQHLGAQQPDSWPSKVCVALATAIFHRAQAQSDFSLPPFYAEEWEQRTEGSHGGKVGRLPAIQALAVQAARFLSARSTAKEFIQEVDRLWLHLREGDHFLIGGTHPLTASPSVSCDGDGAVAIHDSGEVCKVEFGRHVLSIARPSGCSYFYDAEAVKEPNTDDMIRRASAGHTGGANGKVDVSRGDASTLRGEHAKPIVVSGRNRRSVWTIATRPYPEAHFATFPEALVEPCVLAGTKPLDRVLDPFGGSGTVAAVAQRLGRVGIVLELKADYLAMAQRRIGTQRVLL